MSHLVLVCVEIEMQDYTREQVALMNAVRERELEIRECLEMMRALAASPTVTKRQVIEAMDGYLATLG